MLPQRPSGEDRYPPPPPPRSSYHLPPPIPSTTSPHSYASSGIPPPSGQSGHGSYSDWANERDRPLSSSRARWSPTLPFSDRPGSSSSSRLPLPPLEYPHHRGGSNPSWDGHSPSGYPSWNTHNQNPRHSTPYRNHPSPTKPPTPITDNRQPPSSLHNTSLSRPPASSRTSDASGATPQLASPNNKHANNEANSPGDSQKKKKRRVALSCAECAKRKQRCNRETPCQHCVARRVPELCVPYTRAGSPPPRSNRAIEPVRDVKTETGSNPAAPNPPAKTPNMLPTLSVRVARIEALLNVVVNRVDGVEGKALSDWRINHAPATSPPLLHADIETRRRSDSESRRPQTASSLSHPNTANDLDRDSVDPEGSRDGDEVADLDENSSMRNPIPQSMVKATDKGVPLGLDEHGTPAERLQKLFEDGGVSPEKVFELIRELPREEHAGRLVDWFFTRFNYVRYPIDKHVFTRSFKELYASPAVNPRSVLYLPLIFIVFAIATRLAPDTWQVTEEEKRTQSLRMYWNSKSAVIIAQAVKSENIQLIETKILTGLYLILMHERRLAEGWTEFRSAMTIGQAIGLHRDGTKLGLDYYSTEYRRLLWSYLIHADATYSCLLGRPITIDPTCCDVLPPLNINLPELLNGHKPSPRPLSEPTFATYLILRRGLGEIVAKMTQHFQKLEGQTHYRDVESLDSDFKTFIANLPPAFKMLEPDRSYDDTWYLPVHRFYIQTEILHFMIILHRPWLLRKLRSNRYALSRRACIEAASTDFKIRQAFKKDVPDFFETLLASSFREFNVAMIAGISIIIEPRSPHSNDMRAIIKSFMEEHPHDPSADSFSKKEAAIIYTLNERAKELEQQRYAESISRPRSSSIRGTHDNISSERTEPIPQPRKISSNHSTGSHQYPQGTPSTTKSPTAGFWQRNSPSGLVSGTGTSPDEDQPQQLLDHWLLTNTSFGPSSIPHEAPQLVFPSAPDVPLAGDSFMPNAFDGIDAWMDPNLSAAGFETLGLQGGGQMSMMPNVGGGTLSYGPVVDVNRDFGGFVPGQEQGQAGWGSGNSSQYWNNLVDRIAAGMGVGYDNNMGGQGA